MLAHASKVSNSEPVCSQVLKNASPEWSIVSWAFRFLASLDGVITILSGMSTPEQMSDNIHTTQACTPLNDTEKSALAQAIRLYRNSGPIPIDTIEKYRGLTYHGMPATSLLENYSISQIQPNPFFTDDMNYFRNSLAELRHVDIDDDTAFPEETVILPDGTDGTPLLREAEGWLRKNHF